MHNIISKDGQRFSQFSLGCMNLPLDKPNEVEAIIEYSLAHGVNYFDTADFYQFGENEYVLGTILAKYRSQYNFTVGTKVGNSFDKETKQPLGWDPSAKHIKQGVKDSLHRLNVKEIDLYQLHGGTIEDNKDETIQAFEDLKQEGVIKSYGISSIRLNVIDYYLKHSNINTLMSQFNLIDNRPLETFEKLPKDIVLLARGPLMQGLLTDNYKSVLESKHKDGVLGISAVELGERLENLSEKYGRLTELSYVFIAHHNAVIVNGVSSLSQLEENINAFNKRPKLTAEEMQSLYENLNIIKYEEHR